MILATPRRRLDAELVRRELTASRAEAQEAIAAGLVTVDGAPALKAATQVSASQQLALAAPARRFVSRGGEKLAHALEVFDLDVSGRHCLDAGVSTGGFTDCLLQHGAGSVLAYDVGYGQVHDRIRTDPRVEVHERTNVRSLTRQLVGEPHPDLLVADLSFIALGTVLPTLLDLLAPDADAVLLVKPQFEAARHEVGKGGVVRDPEVWRRCVTQVVEQAAALGWATLGVTASALLGPAGNVEFLVHLSHRHDPEGGGHPDRGQAPADAPAATDGPDEALVVMIAGAVAEGRARRGGR